MCRGPQEDDILWKYLEEKILNSPAGNPQLGDIIQNVSKKIAQEFSFLFWIIKKWKLKLKNILNSQAVYLELPSSTPQLVDIFLAREKITYKK